MVSLVKPEPKFVITVDFYRDNGRDTNGKRFEKANRTFPANKSDGFVVKRMHEMAREGWNFIYIAVKRILPDGYSVEIITTMALERTEAIQDGYFYEDTTEDTSIPF